MQRLAFASVLAVVSAVAAGCPVEPLTEGEGEEGEGEGEEGEGEEGEGEEGEGEGEGEEGEGEPPPPPPPNDTCATAIELLPDTPTAGTTFGALDETPCPDGDFFGDDGGGDVSYAFTIDAESGVIITVNGDDMDAVVSVFSDPNCGVGEELPNGDPHVCVDNGEDVGVEERVEVGSLQPGSYFVVVESFFRGADFTINLDLVEPFCEGDADDLSQRTGTDGELVTGNETDQTAALLNPPDGVGVAFFCANVDTANVDTRRLQHLCEGDVDYFLFGHMGGLLTTTVDGGVVSEVREAIVDVPATLDGDVLVYTEGAAVAGLPGSDVDVPPGFYLLRVSEDAVLTGAQNLPYDVVVTHQCVADDLDLPIAELDADFEAQQEAVTLPQEPVARSICGSDVDVIPINALFEGQLVVHLTGVGALDLVAEIVSVDAEGVEAPLDAARVADDIAGTVDFTLDVLPGNILVRLSAPGIAVTEEYAWSLTLPGLDGAPENDTCATATVLTPGVVTGGRTVGGAPDFAGDCNFESFGFGDPANDVFFRFSLADPIATQIDLLPLAGYDGTLALFQLPAGGACPADLTTLTPVLDEFDSGVCIGGFGGTQFRGTLPAGDYLIIVDDDGFGPVPGVFQVEVQTFVDGFPPPPACEADNITAIDLPTTGTTSTIDIAADEFFAGELDPELCTGNGNEKVFSFTPLADGSFTARTQQDDNNDVDTVVYVREGDCVAPAAEDCDDDGSGGDVAFDSILDFAVVGGTTYFLVVDSFRGGEPVAPQSVTLEIVGN